MINVEFKPSADLLDFVKKCDDLDFETLQVGNEGRLIQYINDLEITPYHTGYTQEHNEIVQEGRQKVLANTNEEYGGRIYENGPDIGWFKPSNDILGSEKNMFPMTHWLEPERAGQESAEDFTIRNIQSEVEDYLDGH